MRCVPQAVCLGAGAGAQGTSTIPTTPNIPATAYGTDQSGTAFATPTILVADGQQCGGITGPWSICMALLLGACGTEASALYA